MASLQSSPISTIGSTLRRQGGSLTRSTRVLAILAQHSNSNTNINNYKNSSFFFGLQSSLPFFSLSGERKERVSVSTPALTSSDDPSPSDTTKKLQDALEDLKLKYDSLEDKSSVWIYGGGALLAVWIAYTVLGAINSIPVLPKLFELTGFGYSGWFVYHHLLFKSSRTQLISDLRYLKGRVSGPPRRKFVMDEEFFTASQEE